MHATPQRFGSFGAHFVGRVRFAPENVVAWLIGQLAPGSVARDLPPGRGDGRRLTQVLLNLVGNAIKFTDAGEVCIKASTQNGSFLLSVSDTGPGISTADQAKLFQEFQQADNSITRKKGALASAWRSRNGLSKCTA